MEKRLLISYTHPLLHRWTVLTGLACALALSGCASTGLPSMAEPVATSVDASATPATTVPATPSSVTATMTAPPAANTPISDSSPPNDGPADVWVRIRQGMGMADLRGPRVTQRENWYSSRPDYIQRMTERSGRYLFHIVEEVERRNMPMELALLPFIESAFNPEAVSRVRAAGMWQFMPATGKSFDLQQNAFRDERRDVLASTRAALDYLQQLHDRFGDWHLALAAYNWGQGNVNRAITRNKRLRRSTAYTALKMPRETQDYVPKLQAVKNIIMRPEAFGVTLPEVHNHPFFRSVTIARDMDVSLIVSLADVPEAEFRALNPAHKRPVVLAAATPQILLPWDNAATFERHLAAHEGPLASWTTWTVPRTMTVTQAATQLRVDEHTLRSVNQIPPRMRIMAGSNLLIPRTEKHTKDVPMHVADQGRLTFRAEVRKKSISAKVKPRAKAKKAQPARKSGQQQVASKQKP